MLLLGANKEVCRLGTYSQQNKIKKVISPSQYSVWKFVPSNAKFMDLDI
jgi:hypothetical protein